MKESSLAQGFSLERAFFVLRNRVLEEAPTLGVGLAVVVGINALVFLISKRFLFNLNNGNLWAIAIFLSGVLLSAQAFKGMHDGKSGTDWLLLPAAPLEKYCAAIVDYAILFPVLAALGAAALSALFSLIETAGGKGGFIWTPFNLMALKAWGQYAIASLIFITGSASFRKGAFLKTLAMIIAYALAVSIVLAFGAWVVSRVHGYDNSSFTFMNGSFHLNSGSVPKSVQDALLWIGRVAGYVVIPVFSLLYGYFRVFEKEARDEVQ